MLIAIDIPTPVLLAIDIRYFSDRLSDTDVFLAPVLFRVVTGCAHQRPSTAALPVQPPVFSLTTFQSNPGAALIRKIASVFKTARVYAC